MHCESSKIEYLGSDAVCRCADVLECGVFGYWVVMVSCSFIMQIRQGGKPNVDSTKVVNCKQRSAEAVQHSNEHLCKLDFSEGKGEKCDGMRCIMVPPAQRRDGGDLPT